MAANQGKHSVFRAQGRRRAQASTQTKPEKAAPRLPRAIITRHGKTTIRRYSRRPDGRRFHRFEEFHGKLIDYIEFFTAGGYHALDVRFQDNTSMHFVIEFGFLLQPEYCDWKTGEYRRLKKWPLIRGARSW